MSLFKGGYRKVSILNCGCYLYTKESQSTYVGESTVYQLKCWPYFAYKLQLEMHILYWLTAHEVATNRYHSLRRLLLFLTVVAFTYCYRCLLLPLPIVACRCRSLLLPLSVVAVDCCYCLLLSLPIVACRCVVCCCRCLTLSVVAIARCCSRYSRKSQQTLWRQRPRRP